MKKNKNTFKLIFFFLCFAVHNLSAQIDLNTSTDLKKNILNSAFKYNCSDPKIIRIARWNDAAIGDINFSDFNSQLLKAENYGSNGKYNRILGFAFSNISINYDLYTARQLKESFDIINTGYGEMTVIQASKLKEYSDLGGVVIINCDENKGSKIFQAFGGTGNIGIGKQNTITNNNTILNGVFGIGTNKSVSGDGSFGRFTSNQLPPNSTVLANETTGEPAIFLTGFENRVLFVWDEGVFRNPAVSGTTIDSPQEIVLHNLIVYMIEKVQVPMPTVTVNNPPTTCLGVAVTILATPGTTGNYTYNWTVPTGATAPGNVASFTTKVPGEYSMILSDTATGCTSSSASATVTTYPVIKVDIIAENREACKNENELELTFQADGGIPPYTFKYSLNKGNIKSITTPVNSNFIKLSIPTTVAGTFSYDLISVKDSIMSCDYF